MPIENNFKQIANLFSGIIMNSTEKFHFCSRLYDHTSLCFVFLLNSLIYPKEFRFYFICSLRKLTELSIFQECAVHADCRGARHDSVSFREYCFFFSVNFRYLSSNKDSLIFSIFVNVLEIFGSENRTNKNSNSLNNHNFFVK